ncbi:hypothetical protein CC78DRAFT_614434 [Lojkania enalia]|uniref:Uncharacterized protein n=1 Tax=Lojkania enalia TaxID=147567 RepID=A0A9P4KE76_9PLEO|nr:hypothetical protein CC78DRAFT_614434 [Didymosphaeria enalia]
MKTYVTVFLLYHLSTQAVLAAEAPTFTQKASKEYFGTNGDEVSIGPDDFDIQTKDDFIITLGTEISAKVSRVLDNDCKKPASETCQKNLKDVLGIGPGKNGLHKRVLGLDDIVFAGVGTWLVYSAYECLAYIWNDGYSKNFEKQVQWKIPKEQKEEVQEWKDVDDKFIFKPHEGDPIDVDLDSPPKEKPEDATTLEKESNGDLTMTFPGHGDDLEETFNKVLCKRVEMSCLLSIARALLAQFQAGAGLDGVYYIDPLKEFPKPKNKLLIDALEANDELVENEPFWFGNDDDIKEIRKKYAMLSSWMAFGYTVGSIAVEGDKFTFPKTFLEEQEEEEDEKKKCTENPTFCSNCGGNAIKDNEETQIGKCKGTTNGALKDCKCFVDQPMIDQDWKIDDFKAAYEWMKSLPTEGESDDEEDDKDRPETNCKPKTLPNAFDGPNCSECNDARGFSRQSAYKAAVQEFCYGDWDLTAKPGYKDASKWSATLEFFTDSVQEDPDTKLPPICAISNLLWDGLKLPDSKIDCKASGSWSADSLFRLTVLPAEDQNGCEPLQDYKIPTEEKCEEIFNAIVDDCIPGKGDDETGGYHLDKSDKGCWEWWIYSKKELDTQSMISDTSDNRGLNLKFLQGSIEIANKDYPSGRTRKMHGEPASRKTHFIPPMGAISSTIPFILVI